MAAPKGNDYSPGRLPEYQSDYHDEIAKDLALLGYSLKEMADAMGLSLATLKRWNKEHASFRAAVYEGRAFADATVARAFYKRAVGYEYDAEKIVVVSDGSAVGSHVERVPVVAVVLPDPSAALNWLKNRQPELWTDKQKHELTGDFTFTLNLDGDAVSKTEETEE